MKHFKAEAWIDFVNHIASDDQQRALQKHLGTGCKRCPETLALWQRVANAATVEASYRPSPERVRAVKSTFATTGVAAKRQEADSLIQLLFDSFAQPALAGLRSAAMKIRQMLYRADPYQIDIQIEAQPERNRLLVTGQLLDVNHLQMVGLDVQVTLSDLHGNVVDAVTNQFGEFRGEVENSGDLELSFLGRDGKPIVILLRGALDPWSKATK